jgi:NADPH:quinone reductase-like Zn-dependent oxidoreductase
MAAYASAMSLAIRYERNGGPEVLDVVEVPEPHPEAGQVRVAVKAAGLNPYDYKIRENPAYGPPRTLPSGQGFEFAGVVDELGQDVSDLQLGDEVLGWTDFAAQAEYVVVPAEQLAPKPAELDWIPAGGIGLVGNTAIRAIRSLELGQDDTVVVSAAAGGVGLLAVQFARMTGATVIGTASEANHAFLRGLGVIPVSYGPGLVDRLREAAPGGITAMMDAAGRESIEAALELGVEPHRIDTIAYHPGVKEFGVQAVGGGSKTREELAELATMLASGELVLPIAASYPLTAVREAYEQLESRHLLGKIVLTVP